MTSRRTDRHVLLWCPASRRTYIRDNYCCYSSKAGDLWEPVDLLYQTGFLAQAGLTASVLDAQAERLSEPASVERVAAARPDAILLVTGSACWAADLRQVAAVRRRLPDTIIIASADVLLAAASRLLSAYPILDAALLNYFSDGLVQYLRARWQGGPVPAIPNIAHRAGDRVIVGRRLAPRDARVPLPQHDLFPLRRYRLSISGPGRFATIIASAGCNRACPFCIGSIQRLQLRPADDVEREIGQVRALGVRRLYFYDPNFTSSPERVRAICEAITRASRVGRGSTAWVANAHVACLDEETVRRMADAGCHTVMVGLESANDATLARYGKGFTAAEATAAVARCRAAGVGVLGYFIIGFPEEDEADVLRTIDYARGLGLDYASFNLPVPAPGTPMHVRRRPPAAPLIAGDHSRESSVPHPTLSPARLRALRRLAVRRFYLRPGYLARRCLSALTPRRAAGLLRAAGHLLRSAVR